MIRDRRGASTVLDVCLFCLLVGAAVATLATVPSPTDDRAGDRADAVASTLGGATVTVEYDIRADGAARLERTDHRTAASALATAAVANATVDGQLLDPSRGPYVRAVRERTASLLPSLAPDAAVGITAVWRPYEGAPVSGRVHVGARPPPSAAVHAATLSVPSGVAPDGRAVETADTFRGLARPLARGVVDGRYSPRTLGRALRNDRPAATVVTERYRTAARALGTDVDDELSAGRAGAAAAALTAALTDRLAADMADRFASVDEARAAVTASRVRIVVRTWSR